MEASLEHEFSEAMFDLQACLQADHGHQPMIAFSTCLATESITPMSSPSPSDVVNRFFPSTKPFLLYHSCFHAHDFL